MKVKVKQNHIDSGRPNDCHNCAIALALREELGSKFNMIEVNVEEGQTYFNLDSKYNNEYHVGEVFIDDQQKVNNFVQNFDEKYGYDMAKRKSIFVHAEIDRVKPFEFNLIIQ